MADDLAHAWSDAQGRFHLEELGGKRLERGSQVRLEGGYTALWRLREAMLSGDLPHFPGLDAGAFRPGVEALAKTAGLPPPN